MSSSASPSGSASASASGSVFNTASFATAASLDARNKSSMGSYSGINIPQVIVAGLEGVAICSSFKDAAVLTGSVAISNLVPAGSWIASDRSEKYLAEPLLAGLLYAGASHFMDKKGSMIKNFARGFIVGSSSAALSIEAQSLMAGDTDPRPIDPYAQMRGFQAAKLSDADKEKTQYRKIFMDA